MSMFQAIIMGAAFALAALIGYAYLVKRTPVDKDEDALESEFDALTVIDASRPAPLEMPHVRAGTAYGRELQ